ncbi:glycosyltransferase family 1 protein [Flavobacterium sp. GSB-24]|uniref:glycosyltransferase family 4 protein n=1 Tax=Flavobacterium sp. GSB-24 TaxID=2994319 RepID=UPI0024939021|nr:glycosyltransferase family 1 protein [Flavobacterium sp. GSB-24]BDU23576.1 glycosyl transferase [Flavobacterium sp. GSB-24]
MKNYKGVLGINLLNFNSDKLAGAGYFIKRIFYQLQLENFNKRIVIFVPNNLDVSKVFDLDCNKLDFEIVKIAGINSFIKRIIFEQTLFISYLRKLDYYYSPTPALPILLKVFLPNIKSIVTIHDLIPFYFPKKYPFFRRLYVKLITKLGAKFADTIITVSKSTKKDLISHFDISHDKIVIVYNFIPELIKEEESIINKYFVTVSTIEPGKNLINIIKAFYEFQRSDKGKDFLFYICGKDGWDSKNIYSLVDELGLQDKIVFTGYLEEDKKNDLIKGSYAMIYVSFYEGFGIPPLEAMYYSKPSIVSNNSSLPEVVGLTGLLCNPNNSVEICSAMKEMLLQRSSLIKNIPSQLEFFDPSKQLEIFINAIYVK